MSASQCSFPVHSEQLSDPYTEEEKNKQCGLANIKLQSNHNVIFTFSTRFMPQTSVELSKLLSIYALEIDIFHRSSRNW